MARMNPRIAGGPSQVQESTAEICQKHGSHWQPPQKEEPLQGWNEERNTWEACAGTPPMRAYINEKIRVRSDLLDVL